ncbi:S8 family serine peptidase [Jiangella muralis]|uniref:S8 family serine peptidase n=1 Tax=Jiangella muralis TaxID=702383 RepID=UPI00069D7484|nr:S8 family serine peptidase [Jiangella muralis]
MTPHTIRTHPRLRRFALAAVAVAGLLAATTAHGGDDPATAAPLDGAPVSLPTMPGETVTITLITGDRVEVIPAADGAPEVAGVEPAPRAHGAPIGFQTFRHDDDVYVVPSDASGLLAADRLDPELFNVSGLLEDGITGAAGLPLIVQYDATRRQPAQALPGGERGPSLESINGSGLHVDAADAATFWAAVDPAPAASAAARLDRGLARIWLDRPVEASLDVSVPQVGAPEAWEAGYDGDRVTVAVLDTGVDAGHPDLVGQVADSRSFVPDQEVADGHGHGTHVASTVAGIGGRYRGVAPGARLLVGKVLNDSGSGSSSWIIEGMEWAVEQGARVVSMSLGGDPTDGTDPMSQAVNQLSAESGALFVIAAGNSGPEAGTVGAPGAADAALTVAAVDKQDDLASFSSRGPRVGDAGLKPDLAAPGVKIVAARAAGTSLGEPLDELHTAASGTSMATPHVAGAAAILAQQHPDWSGPQLKAALTSTVADVGGTVPELGAGRLDVARATTQGVVADGPLWFGHLPYPQTAPVTRSVAYTNTGTAPVVLDLTATLTTAGGAPAPDGLIAVRPRSLTVPAGGTATAEIVVDASGGSAAGLYQGRITAASATGSVRLTTVTGVYVEPETFDLTVSATLPEGSTAAAFGGWLVVRNDGWIDFADNLVRLPAVPKATVELPRGDYTVATQIGWYDANGESNIWLPLEPQAQLDGDTTVRFDLAEAARLGASTDQPAEAYGRWLRYERTGAGDAWSLRAELPGATGATSATSFWMTPTDPVDAGTLELTSQQVLGPPLLSMQTLGARPLTLRPRYRSADITVPKLDTVRPFPVVDAGSGTPEEQAGADVAGALVLISPDDLCTPGCASGLADRVSAAAQAGAAGVLVTGPLARPVLGATPLALPVATLPPADGAALAAELDQRPVRVRLGGDPSVPSLTLVTHTETGAVPADLDYEVADEELAVVHHDLHLDAADGTATRRLLWWVGRDKAELPYVTAPRRLTVRVGPADPGIVHTIELQDDDNSDGGLYLEDTRQVFGAAGPYEVAWNSGPLVPGPATRPTGDGLTSALSACAGCRLGDVFLPFMYLGPSAEHEASMLGLVEGGALVPGPHICRPDDPEHPPSGPPRYQCEVRLYDEDGDELEPRLVSESGAIPPIGAAATEEDR